MKRIAPAKSRLADVITISYKSAVWCPFLPSTNSTLWYVCPSYVRNSTLIHTRDGSNASLATKVLVHNELNAVGPLY